MNGLIYHCSSNADSELKRVRQNFKNLFPYRNSNGSIKEVGLLPATRGDEFKVLDWYRIIWVEHKKGRPFGQPFESLKYKVYLKSASDTPSLILTSEILMSNSIPTF